MLRTLRKRKKLTQQALADRADLTKPYISQLESGARTPSLAALKKLARALGVPVAELLE